MMQTIKKQLTQTFVVLSEFFNSTETANTAHGN
jgi:hypothetical protein